VLARWRLRPALSEGKALGGPALEPAPREVQPGLRVTIGGGLVDRVPALDLVIDDFADHAFAGEVGPLGLEVETGHDRPLQAGCERELDPALHRDRHPELGHELLKGHLQRLGSALERRGLVELVPDDRLALSVSFELVLPAAAIPLQDLVHWQRVAVFELVAVVVAQRLVDAGADDHRGRFRLAMPEDVFAPPGFLARLP
jgi:hypothetical protein